MGKILEAFAEDELCIEPAYVELSPQRKKLLDQCDELLTKLNEKLDDEEQELLTRIINTILDENHLHARDKFIRGYRLGVLMTTEVFSEQDSYLDNSDR